MSETRSRTWISAEISPELMESLERRAKARGISRSEGLRQALRQWTTDGGRETRVAEDRRRQIVERLDELREELLLELSDESSTSSTSENTARKSTAEASTGHSEDHVQMELYE